MNTREKIPRSRLRLSFVLLAQQRGFSLIEIAIVMVIIGLLAGGGISVMGILTQRKARNETIDYLKQAEAALVSFAGINGRLPWADTSANGNENSGASAGTLPYQTLKLLPTDPNKRSLKYALNGNLGTDRATSCTALRVGLAGGPAVVDGDGAAIPVQVAAVLVSAGVRDADGDGNIFDRIGTGTHQGDNTDGSPNYLRYPPIDVFDDLVVYLGENLLYGEICEYLALAVNNNSAGTVYVHNRTQGSDLGLLASGTVGTYSILSGTQIDIRSGAGGGGAIVPSSPPTPLALAGRGFTINLP
ncbi:MAG: prepilin-type N-terminal cleavage/methylation domain-containing protein [Desulfobacterales bacterium]